MAKRKKKPKKTVSKVKADKSGMLSMNREFKKHKSIALKMEQLDEFIGLVKESCTQFASKYADQFAKGELIWDGPHWDASECKLLREELDITNPPIFNIYRSTVRTINSHITEMASIYMDFENPVVQKQYEELFNWRRLNGEVAVAMEKGLRYGIGYLYLKKRKGKRYLKAMPYSPGVMFDPSYDEWDDLPFIAIGRVKTEFLKQHAMKELGVGDEALEGTVPTPSEEGALSGSTYYEIYAKPGGKYGGKTGLTFKVHNWSLASDVMPYKQDAYPVFPIVPIPGSGIVGDSFAAELWEPQRNVNKAFFFKNFAMVNSLSKVVFTRDKNVKKGLFKRLGLNIIHTMDPNARVADPSPYNQVYVLGFERSILHFERLSGVSGVMSGTKPPGIRSGRALGILANLTMSGRTIGFMKNLESDLVYVAHSFATLLKQKVKEVTIRLEALTQQEKIRKVEIFLEMRDKGMPIPTGLIVKYIPGMVRDDFEMIGAYQDEMTEQIQTQQINGMRPPGPPIPGQGAGASPGGVAAQEVPEGGDFGSLDSLPQGAG